MSDSRYYYSSSSAATASHRRQSPDPRARRYLDEGDDRRRIDRQPRDPRDDRYSRGHDNRRPDYHEASREREGGYRRDAERRHREDDRKPRDDGGKRHDDRRYPHDDQRQVHHERRPRSRSPRGHHSFQLDGDPIKFDRNRRLSPFRGDSVPLNQRPRPLQNWDAAPPGFERIRADIAKQTGLFPPPGNVAKMAAFAPPVLDPARAAMLAMLSGDTNANNLISQSGVSAYAKHTRRIYVGNLPVTVTERELEDYFNTMLRSDRPEEMDQPAITTVMLSADRTYAFIDLRTPELTNLALEMNGMQFSGSRLKIQRPRSEHTDPLSAANESDDGPETFVLSGLPDFFQDAHVRMLLLLVGELRQFIFLRDRHSRRPFGLVVFQFEENVFNEIARDAISDVTIGQECKLSVNRLSECRQDPDIWSTLSAFNLIPDIVSTEMSPVIALYNLLPLNSLPENHASFSAVEEAIKSECVANSLHPLAVLAPVPLADGTPTPGVGRVYIAFGTGEEAERALALLCGRRFGSEGELVIGSFYPKERFDAGNF